MFRVMLYSQWKWSRLIVVIGAIAGFTLPVVSVQGAARAGPGALSPMDLLQTLQSWGTFYPVLAAALGLLVAVAAWTPDHRGRHVHALSLPLPRWRYVVLRYGAGATLLAAPVCTVLVGAMLAAASATVPPGLQAYPFGLALRFGLAVALAYSLFFAVSSGTSRTAGFILGGIGAVIGLQVVAGAAGISLDLPGRVLPIVLNWPGPLAIFTGRWMLIDV